MSSDELIGKFEFKKWSEEFEMRAKADFYARRSWERLSELGFRANHISLGFFLACDFPDSPGYAVFSEMREQERHRAKSAKRLISRLNVNRRDLKDLLGIGLDGRASAASTSHRETEQGDSRPTESESLSSESTCDAERQNAVGESMPSFGSISVSTQFASSAARDLLGIEPIAGPLQKWGSSKKAETDRKTIAEIDTVIARLTLLERDARQESSKRVNGPSAFLALGITLIRACANQPLYRDYANLLNVANQVFGHDELLIGEDAVRKTFQRFMKRNPDAFNVMRSPEMLLVIVTLVIAMFLLPYNAENV